MNYKDIFKNAVDKVNNKFHDIQEETVQYKNLLNTTGVVSGLYNISKDEKDCTISWTDIVEECPDLNEEKAALIRRLLEVDEVYLTIMYSRECRTNKEYFLIPTNKCFWIISLEGYLQISYEELGKASTIKNNLMSKVILLSNILFLVNGGDERVDNFMKIVNDSKYREDISFQKLEKFCGIVPVKSYINDLGTGISIGLNEKIVFHTNEINYRCNVKDIKNYELLLDDNVVREKKQNMRIRLTTGKSSCYQMNIRISTDTKTFLLPIIEKGVFGEFYQSNSETFINGKNFADKIMDILDEMDINN